MKRLLANLLRTVAYLAICVLVGYYHFQSSGWIGVATNVLYLVIGIMMAETWLKARNKSEPISEGPSLNGIDTAAQSASDPAEIAKEETSIGDSTATEPI